MFLGNLIVGVAGADIENWVLVLVLTAAALGAAGAVLFLLSFDGPARWRTRSWRIAGWSGMFLCVMLPTGLSFFLLPLVGVASLTLAMKPVPPTPSEPVATAA
jgi:hypothetical protein